MKFLKAKILAFAALCASGGCVFAQAEAPQPAPQTSQRPAETVSAEPASAQKEAPQAESAGNLSQAPDRIEQFRQRREARRAARRDMEEQPSGGSQRFERRRPPFGRGMPRGGQDNAQQLSETRALPETAQANLPESELLRLLVSKNPFAQADGKAGEQNPEGLSLKSAVMVDGIWSFSVSDKSGKTFWLELGQALEEAPCKIESFDERAMVAKASAGGKIIDLAIVARSANHHSGRVELVEAIRPRRMIAPHERAKVWSQYATDEQREAANRVWQTARAQGRNYLNREDRRKIFEIERSIQIPENQQNQGGGVTPPPQMPQR